MIIAFAAMLGATIWVVSGRRQRAASIATVLSLALTLALPAVIITGVNRLTQTGDEGRAQGGPVPAAMSRVVWPHLEEIRATWTRTLAPPPLRMPAHSTPTTTTLCR